MTPRTATTPRPFKEGGATPRPKDTSTPRPNKEGNIPQLSDNSSYRPVVDAVSLRPTTMPKILTRGQSMTITGNVDKIESIINKDSNNEDDMRVISDLSSSCNRETLTTTSHSKEVKNKHPPVSKTPETSREVHHTLSFNIATPKSQLLEPQVSPLNLKRTSTMSNDQLGKRRNYVN